MSWRYNRRIAAVACALTVALAGAACEVENITAVGEEDANPLRLIRGASYQFEFFYVQFGNSMYNATGEGGSGTVSDPTAIRFFERNFGYIHHARVLSEMAITRAQEEQADSLIGLAYLMNGWVNVRLAEIYGDQPLGGEEVHTAESIFETALASFEAARDDAVDSVRLGAIAGEARVHWRLGRDPVDATHLNAAIAAADEVLAEEPAFKFAPIYKRPNYLTTRPAAPGFEDIPRWWQDEDNVGMTLIDADELRLIKAESYLLLNQLDAAKEAVKSTALLPINHIGLAGRDPDGAPLTDAEIDAYIDPMSADELMFVIEELRRELFYGQARRDVGPNEDGTMFPLPYPPNG